MGKLLIIVSLLFATMGNSPTIDGALQTVLELEEVKAYFNKSPRFTSSEHYAVVLFKAPQLELVKEPSINSIPVKVVDLTASVDKSKWIGYIQLNQLSINKKVANVVLDIQNAELLQEEKKKVRVTAKLKLIDKKWEVQQHSLEDISISE